MSFRLSWSSDQSPPITFRVYKEGVLYRSFSSSTNRGSCILYVGEGESPFVEVLDKACSIPSIAFPGRITLNWLSVDGAASYTIRENNSGWQTVATIVDDGSGVFSFTSRWLEDSLEHEFQVIPVDVANNEGSPLEFSVLEVRHPDVPSVSYSYSAGTAKVTISAS